MPPPLAVKCSNVQAFFSWQWELIACVSLCFTFASSTFSLASSASWQGLEKTFSAEKYNDYKLHHWSVYWTPSSTFIGPDIQTPFIDSFPLLLLLKELQPLPTPTDIQTTCLKPNGLCCQVDPADPLITVFDTSACISILALDCDHKKGGEKETELRCVQQLLPFYVLQVGQKCWWTMQETNQGKHGSYTLSLKSVIFPLPLE